MSLTWDAKEALYQQALQTEQRYPDSIGPDGCFYCGGNHSSDCCLDTEARDEYWRESEDE